jgi:hypothetical protein
MEPMARAILSVKPLSSAIPEAKQVIRFTDAEEKEHQLHFAEIFLQMLEAMPAVVPFQELARQEMEARTGVSEAQKSEIIRMFDVKPESVDKYAGR